ncbi:MAG: TIGR00159 family protein [Bacteroidetes bacterium B1(2017)]|nr:MAG: TIGR00159 family protein [Bacteroidetes bacterium B1(2017)]
MFDSKFELFSYTINPINIIDVLLVVFLCFQLFKLLKGSLAFNILIGLITIYMFWLVVRYFEMPLMAGVLGEFAKVGIIAVLIVFQQEIRKFLLVIGNSSLLGEKKKWWNIFPWKWKIQETFHTPFDEIVEACRELSSHKTGAIIVFPITSEMKFIATSGEAMDSIISKRLILAIFNKNSPLHDGAVIISGGKIKAANCVLPVSENPQIINKYGLRHLSAIGITEQTDAVCLVVSEEKGSISYIKEGKIEEGLLAEEIIDRLNEQFSKEMVTIGE